MAGVHRVFLGCWSFEWVEGMVRPCSLYGALAFAKCIALVHGMLLALSLNKEQGHYRTSCQLPTGPSKGPVRCSWVGGATKAA